MKGVHKKATERGEHQTIEARLEGDLIFAGNQETGEVALRTGGWVDFLKLKKSTAKKLADFYMKHTVELWVEAAGIPEHIDKIVDDRLPAVVDKLIAAQVEKVAGEILETMLREKLKAQLAGELAFDIDVTVSPRS